MVSHVKIDRNKRILCLPVIQVIAALSLQVAIEVQNLLLFFIMQIKYENLLMSTEAKFLPST
jgi:hypothetical protein